MTFSWLLQSSHFTKPTKQVSVDLLAREEHPDQCLASVPSLFQEVSNVHFSWIPTWKHSYLLDISAWRLKRYFWNGPSIISHSIYLYKWKCLNFKVSNQVETFRVLLDFSLIFRCNPSGIPAGPTLPISISHCLCPLTQAIKVCLQVRL